MNNAATKHTCNGGNGPLFGRKTAGCPRCDELLALVAALKAISSFYDPRVRRATPARDALAAHHKPEGKP